MENFPNEIKNLTFAAQNCNSFNVSANCLKQLKKIAAIISLSASIIFLSDIRLNTEKNLEANSMFKNLSNDSYTFYTNSTKSKRGVGILISKKIQYDVLNEFKDAAGNILCIKIRICNTDLLLVSVYGPNTNDGGFFLCIA
jgi:exonuclease III